MNGMGGLGSPMAGNVTGQNPAGSNGNPLSGGNMMGNPFFSMIGSGFGNNQGMNYPSNQQNPYQFINPLLANGNLDLNQNNQNGTNSQNSGLLSLIQNMQNIQQKAVD
jgi:hypothetical protein